MKQITQKELLLLSHNFQVRFALFCAYQVEDKWKPFPEAIEAVRMAELWLEWKASSKECEVAAHAANVAYAAANAAANAAYAATNASYAAYAASYAASGKDKAKLTKEQWDYYNQLLSFHEEFERVMFA